MEENSEILEAPDSLLTDPTVLGWSVELQRILHGQREFTLLRLGSVTAYVNKIINRSTDEALSRSCFEDALSQTVQSWQPNERTSKEYLACMLDLIAGYAPFEGAAKVAGFLKRWGTFSTAIESSGGYGADYDLNSQALVALDSFFTTRPHEELQEHSLIFDEYSRLLLDYLETATYGGYVATRLIDLGIIKASDKRISELLRADPSALYELLSFFFSPNSRSRLKTNLQALSSIVIESSEEVKKVFSKVLKSHGARVIPIPGGLQITLDDQSVIEIETSKELVGASAVNAKDTRQVLQSARLNAQISQVPKLLETNSRQSEKLVWDIFEQCLMAGSNWIADFDYMLKQVDAKLEHDPSAVRIVVGGGTRIAEELSLEARLRYMAWFMQKGDVPPKNAIIQKLEAAV